MLELSPTQRRELRARAHALHPVVSIAGKGLSAAVLKEIELSLKAHELIKIRVYGDDREQRAALYTELCQTLACAPIQHIGKLLVVFRPNPESETAGPIAKIKHAKSPRTARRPAKSNTSTSSNKIATTSTRLGRTAKPARSATHDNRRGTAVRSSKRSSKD